MTNFSDFGLSKEIEKAISNMGFEEPTPIQAQAIPIALTGKDLIGQAQTGTGKTTAFGIPLLEKLMHVKAFKDLSFVQHVNLLFKLRKN